MEPEIIPPNNKRSAKDGTKVKISLTTRTGSRQLTSTGLLAILLFLAVTILFAVIFAAVLGVVIVWVLGAVLLVAILLLLGIGSRIFGRLRN
jgi:hypothetical protein